MFSSEVLRKVRTDIDGNAERVAVIYDGFPHYRKGIIEALAASTRGKYFFFGDSSYRAASIKTYPFGAGVNFVPAPGFSVGPLFLQRGILRGLLRNRITHCIFLGNPWFITYWALVPILRLTGRKVYFWTHGWISQRESWTRRLVRHAFFRLPNALLLYGNRSKDIGVSHGFSATRLFVINNSLDYPAQKKIFDGLASKTQVELRQEFGFPLERRIIICTARLTEKCRFDILLAAAGELQRSGDAVFLVLVGDGPAKESLTRLAAALGVDHVFWGECYDELTIAKLYKAADLTVSPGKVGLTALHSMAYGTPVLSHDNFDHQMPEYEAIEPGVTGDFFTENSSAELAGAIVRWFQTHPVKPERACTLRVEAQFTPQFQRQAIEAAIFSHQEAP